MQLRRGLVNSAVDIINYSAQSSSPAYHIRCMDVAHFIFSRKLLNLPGVQCWCAPGHRPLIPGYSRPARYCTAPIRPTLGSKTHTITATITIATSQSNDFQYRVRRCIINYMYNPAKPYKPKRMRNHDTTDSTLKYKSAWTVSLI